MAKDAEEFRPVASLSVLRQRARLLQQLRKFFERQQFLEVTTPLWSHDTVVDRHLDPVPVVLANDARCPSVGRVGWLQTSPEQHMKRLLAAGAEAIFQVTPVFRNGERGPLHNPEFTMLEWYRVGDDYQAGQQLLAELTVELLPGRGEPVTTTYRQAFEQYAGLDPFTASNVEVWQRAKQFSSTEFAVSERDYGLDLILVHLIEPRLGCDRPTILCDYPGSQSALAQVRHDSSGSLVAERFELYVDGIELANGYHELLDADELMRRNKLANELRRIDRKPELPVESRLLAAMRSGLPSCAGTALGFDRLVMVAVGATTIDQVLTFPIERA